MVCGQLHAAAALPPAKDLSMPFGFEACSAPVPVWRLCQGNRTLAVEPVGRRYTNWAIPGSIYINLIRFRGGE
jgi:hypothetical protein